MSHHNDNDAQHARLMRAWVTRTRGMTDRQIARDIADDVTSFNLMIVRLGPRADIEERVGRHPRLVEERVAMSLTWARAG